MSELFDSDGENRAVRGFLLGLEANCKTFAAMRQHLTSYGTPSWPDHFNVAQGHITKAEQQEWLRHLFALERRAQPAQAEAVPVVDRVYEAAKRLVDHADFQLGGVLSAKSKARDIPSNAASKVKARHLASLRDALAKTPQQAEAVPSDVVRDAERYRWLRLNKPYVVRVGGDSIHCGGHYPFKDSKYGPALDAAIDAAIAQQKGQP